MAYLAIARKWRPSRFEDLVGQEHVVQTIKNAISLDRVSHAYLFCGARGIGKTSVARIFAKSLRCPNAKDAVPCNQCEECQLIAESRSVDVVEIDGASNNGVEAVRQIRENVPYGASSGRFKIYIIDEVHMLTLSAFNALLKTLEEPPAHVIFIFATTEAQKIPVTILSRCQRFEFRRLTNVQIINRMKIILETEKIALSEEGLHAIASHADGSLRDALSLLDQVLSYFGAQLQDGKALTEKQVVAALGVQESGTVREFLGSILSANTTAIIKSIGEAYQAGIDLKHFSERCLEELRLLYLITLGQETRQTQSPTTLDVSLGHFEELSALAKNASLTQIERMAQIFSRAISQLGWAASPRFVLEMAAIRMTRLDELARIESILTDPRPVAPQAQATPAAPPAPLRVAPTPTQSASPQSAPAPQQNNNGPRGMAPPPPTAQQMGAPNRPAPAPHSAPRPQTEEGIWKSAVDAVMKKRPLLGALLSHANFKMDTQASGSKTVTLAFPTGTFYERQAMDPKNRLEIETHLKGYFGPDTKVSHSNDVLNTTRSLEQTRKVETDAIKKDALEHPMVVKMQEVLGAEVVDVNVEL